MTAKSSAHSAPPPPGQSLASRQQDLISPRMALERDSSKNGPLLAVHEVALTLHASSHYSVERKHVFRAAEGSVT